MSNPLSLYVHFPWCVKKCPYCDFNSHEIDGVLPEKAYIDALEADLLRDLTAFKSREIQSIFIGGGTPSLFSPEAIADLFNRLQRHLVFARDIEITLEANPGTTDFKKFSGYCQAGINRLSLGVQSSNNRHLNLLGRIHSSNEIFDAFDAAIKAGFTNINLDLMHGLAGQSVEDAMQDLQQAIALKPTHMSWYQLTIEPNTQYYKQPPILPGDDDLWDIYSSGLALLAQHGYERYEVSAFSQNGFQCQHNLNYWLFGDYLGIGAGAHSKISENGIVTRASKTRTPKDYLASQKAKTSAVSPDELTLEFLMNALRLNQGFSTDVFQQRTGLDPLTLDPFLETAIRKSLIERSDNQIKPTTKGLQYLNELLMLVD